MAEERTLPESTEELKETKETESEEEVEASEEEEEVEETVNLKKTEYDKLLEERDNYKKATLSLKKKPQSEATPKPPAGGEDDNTPITKGEFYKTNEKIAIRQATTVSEDDPEEIAVVKEEIDANWDAIVGHVHATDRSTPDAIYDAILDAHAAWKRRQKPKSEADKKVRSELSATRGLGGKAPLKAKPERKKILQIGQGMEGWYEEK